MSAPLRKIGTRSATALVIANMIGTGVFTSLGFQLVDLQNTWSILFLWIIGGGIALAGALSYAELGAYYRRSGGEYHFLSALYGPLVGYLAGWVSLTVGFAAPVALAAMALAAYTHTMTGMPATAIATLVLVLLAGIHSVHLRRSSRFQDVTTALKVVVIILFLAFGLAGPAWPEAALDWSASWQREIWLPAFGVALVYVTYAYSGWNAAAYIVEEIRDPARQLPQGLAGRDPAGDRAVRPAPVGISATGQPGATSRVVEVGQIVAENRLGRTGGYWISGAIALFLISSISAMVWVGPRVSQRMADDHTLWHFLQPVNTHGIPVRAIWFQTLLSLIMVWTGTFETVLLYCGFILQLFAALAVGGSFLLRRKGIDLPYRSPAHPVLPALFLAVSLGILIFLIWEKPQESLFGLSNLALGWITYRISRPKQS